MRILNFPVVRWLLALLVAYLLGMLTLYLLTRTPYTPMANTPQMVRCLSHYRVPFYFSENQREMWVPMKRVKQIADLCS